MVPINIEGKKCNFELDTGASVSLVSEKVYRDQFGDLSLTPCEGLKTYSGEKLPVLEKVTVHVQYGNQSRNMPLRVVAGDGPSLFGRDWLEVFRLDWSSIHAVKDSTKTDAGVTEMLSKYSVFDNKLGTVKGVTAHLKMKENATPVFYKPRPVPYALKDQVSEELSRLEKNGVLKKVNSSQWACPIVPVRKADGSVRICGDYKVTINSQLDVPQYPIPKPQDLFTKLNGGQKFSKLDLSNAYHQVPLDEKSQEYVTINTEQGLYQYTRLPYGVSSCPAVFQETMDKVLHGLPGVGCYMDDLIVTGKDDAEHRRNLENVIRRLDEHGIKLKFCKCVFMKPSLEYLGYMIDKDGLHPSPTKVSAILEAKTPENVAELQSFMGMVNYYNSFIPNMSTLVSPLNRLRKKDVPFEWNTDCAQAFDKLKQILASSQLLIHYDSDKPLTLAVDASQYGIGAVISHETTDGERPIAYASRTLTSAEKNYSQIEKEGLSIIFGIRRFHQYLYGRQFTLITDHKPLTFLLGPKKGIPVLTVSRLQRWAIQLSAYTYDIKYRTSKENANADALSRLPCTGEKPEPTRDSHVFWTSEATLLNISQVNSLPICASQISRATQTDIVLSRVKFYISNGWPAEKELSTDFVPYYRRRDELTSEEGCLLWGTRVIVPKIYQENVLDCLHDTHQGIVKTKSLARLHVWWPNLDEQIEQLVRSCSECQQVNSKPMTRTNPWIWPSRVYQRIHVDYADYHGEMFLIVVGARSKWPEVIHMKSTTSTATINAMRSLIARYGIPEVIVSDNGPQFTSCEFKEFLTQNRIRHVLSSPYHPSSNGEAERCVKTVKKALTRMTKEPSDLNRFLCRTERPHTVPRRRRPQTCSWDVVSEQEWTF